MKLYMHPVSMTSRPVRLFMAEKGLKADEVLVDVMTGAHYQEPYASLNPNRLVPMLEDDGFKLTESSAILKYLAEKFDAFLPKHGAGHAECLSWLFWQMGSAPYLGGGFGHFYAYAPAKFEYAIDRQQIPA